jgi:uncharacterized membrane protein
VRRQRPFYIFVLGIVVAIPTAWFLAGESGLGTMIATIVLIVVFTALFEALWRRLTKPD